MLSQKIPKLDNHQLLMPAFPSLHLAFPYSFPLASATPSRHFVTLSFSPVAVPILHSRFHDHHVY